MTHYYYSHNDKALHTCSHPKQGDGWEELTHLQYDAARLLLLYEGGYEAIASAAYKCGLPAPSHNGVDYHFGWCMAEDGETPDKPVRWHYGVGKFLCRTHYEQAKGETE